MGVYMSRKKRVARFTLSQAEADELIRAVKRAVEDTFDMPAAGDHNAEFHVRSMAGDEFTVAVYQGKRDANRHSMSARVAKLGVPLLRLCVNSSPHANPDGVKVAGTHWHIYKEGADDFFAYPAELDSDGFVEATIALLDKFNVIERPIFQERLI